MNDELEIRHDGEEHEYREVEASESTEEAEETAEELQEELDAVTAALVVQLEAIAAHQAALETRLDALEQSHESESTASSLESGAVDGPVVPKETPGMDAGEPIGGGESSAPTEPERTPVEPERAPRGAGLWYHRVGKPRA